MMTSGFGRSDDSQSWTMKLPQHDPPCFSSLGDNFGSRVLETRESHDERKLVPWNRALYRSETPNRMLGKGLEINFCSDCPPLFAFGFACHNNVASTNMLRVTLTNILRCTGYRFGCYFK